jgi:hypothetical protein
MPWTLFVIGGDVILTLIVRGYGSPNMHPFSIVVGQSGTTPQQLAPRVIGAYVVIIAIVFLFFIWIESLPSGE